MIRSVRAPIAIALGVTSLMTVAHTQSLTYPKPKRVEVVDDYFGVKVADPYRWMEDLNALDVKLWIDAQNDITFKYLDVLPSREELRKRITDLWNYPRVSAPAYRGGRWFYARNSGLQRQAVYYTRASLTSPERVAIDPNLLSPDGSVALSDFIPSPDGKHFAYGQSEGGSDWSAFYVRE